jgi:RNA polymerase sigma factor (sigma-70 family)
MKKYNIQNYIRYKEDLKVSMPGDKIAFSYYTRDELIVKFMPLVENLARKFSTTQQASGVLSINDLIQEGNSGLIRAVDKLDWTMLDNSEDIEKTLKSFFSKRIKGAIRRAIDINRGDIKIPEHKLNEIRNNPEDKKHMLPLERILVPNQIVAIKVQILKIFLLQSKYLHDQELLLLPCKL